MKTFKTNLGIEFDVEVLEIHNGTKESTVLFLATCQEGSNEFQVSISNYGNTVDHYIELTEEECEVAHTWVNQQVVGFISSELAKICLSKKNYWSFSVSTLNVFQVSVLEWEDNKVVGSYTATGEEDIYSLVYQLKNSN